MIDYSIFPNKIKALFFDMDGVLYDSMPKHAFTWVESFKAAGIDFPAYEAYMNEGATGNYTIKKVFRQLGREATEEDINRIYDHKSELMNKAPLAPIMPGMQQVVADTLAAGIKVIIVTGSKQPSLISRLNDDFNIGREDIVSGFDVKNGKPDPEPYLRALGKAACPADEAIVVENAPLGILSARAAGLFAVAVNTGILKPEVLSEAGASLVLDSTSQLAEMWPNIIRG